MLQFVAKNPFGCVAFAVLAFELICMLRRMVPPVYRFGHDWSPAILGPSPAAQAVAGVVAVAAAAALALAVLPRLIEKTGQLVIVLDRLAH